MFPLPGKVYSSDGVRDSAFVKKWRLAYFDAHVDNETAEVLLTAAISPPDDTKSSAGSTPFSALSDSNLASFNSAFFAIIAVSSNCEKKRE